MPSKILIIDDERPTLAMFALFLEAYGYEVFTAASGAEGIEMFRKHAVPIVLTDIKMPGMNGLEVLDAIKKIDPVTEVIIITGHGDMDLAISALGLGATDFINKPIQQAKLDAALNRAKERIRRSHDEKTNYVVRKQGESSVIEICGEVNSKAETRLDDAFSSALREAGKLVLSFTKESSINGAGMALLTQRLLECRDNGKAVALCGLTDDTKKIVDMVGIGKLARIFDTEEEALENS